MLCTKCHTNETQDNEEICFTCYEKENNIFVNAHCDEVPDDLLSINYKSPIAHADMDGYRDWLKENGSELMRIKIPKDLARKYSKFIYLQTQKGKYSKFIRSQTSIDRDVYKHKDGGLYQITRFVDDYELSNGVVTTLVEYKPLDNDTVYVRRIEHFESSFKFDHRLDATVVNSKKADNILKER